MKNYNIRLAVITALLVGAVWVTIDNILIRPFPFIDVSYISSIEEFNAPPTRLDVDINLPLSIETIKKAVSYTKLYNYDQNNKVFSDIQKATAATKRLMGVSQGNDIRALSNALLENPKFHDGCSEASKVFSIIMQSLGYQARVIWMKGHTVSEVFTEKNGWVLVDVYGNVVFRNKSQYLWR